MHESLKRDGREYIPDIVVLSDDDVYNRLFGPVLRVLGIF